jgi:type II secretory pathway component PulF
VQEPQPATIDRNTPASLPFTLRMYAEEAGSTRVAAALRDMSRRLENGATWEQAVSNQRGLPAFLKGVFLIGERSGQLGPLLAEFLFIVRRNRRTQRQIVTVLAYPALLLLAATAIVLSAVLYLIPEFKGIYNDFGVSLPGITKLLIYFSDSLLLIWKWLAIGAGIVFAMGIAWLLLPYIPFGATMTRAFQVIPVVGTASWLAGASEFCSLLAILVRARVPLPEALRLTSTAIRDASLRSATRRLAEGVERGKPVDEAAERLPEFRRPLIQVLRSAKRGDVFADVLRSHGELFMLQAEAHSRMALVWIEPFLLVLIGFGLAFIISALFWPLFNLLNELA